MANPRRKHSKSRTRKRRSVYYGGLASPTIVECGCPRRNLKLRHHVCPSCGMYRGRQIVEQEDEA